MLGLSSSTHIEVTGDPRVILNARTDASLLVLGSHHRGHLSGLLAASTAEWLLVRPPAPMLLARHGYPTRAVAILLDGSPHSQRAFETFWSLPWARDVAVHLVSVDDGSIDVVRCLQWASVALPQGVVPDRVSRLSGTSTKVLAQYVHANHIDLVVMGTRGLTGLRRMRVGSTVSALLKDGSANLLIAHVPDPETSEVT